MAVGVGAIGPGISGTSSGGGGGSGTVTSVSVATANGFAGTVTNPTTTPAITIKTSITGLTKGNGTALSAAVAGTDYTAGLSAAATGLVVSTTGTGAVTTVTAPAGTVVGTTDTQTLTNKTLTAPVIATITNTGTLTLPTSTDTLVGRATTDTLTNKRITKRVLATSAPGATPTIDTDNYDVVHFTGVATSITSMTTNLSGTPVDGDTLRISFAASSGGPYTITWGASFEASTELPTTLTAGTANRLDVSFFWNTETSAWRCVGAVPGPVILQTDLAAVNTPLTTTSVQLFASQTGQPALPTLTPGKWKIVVVLLFGGDTVAAIPFTAVPSGGTATYTVIQTTGPPAVTCHTSAASAGSNHIPLTLEFNVIVTGAGTVGVIGAVGSGGGGSPIIQAQDTTLSGITAQVSHYTATLMG